MLPRERGGVGQEFGGNRLASAAEIVDGIGQVGRVPIDDGRDHHRSAARGYLEVSPFDLHCDGPTKTIRFLAPAPNSSAIAITPASIRAGSSRSSEKVVSDPEDFRSRSD